MTAQKGFIPLVMILGLLVAAGTSFFIYKTVINSNYSVNPTPTPQPTSVPTPTFTPTITPPKTKTTVKVTPTPTQTKSSQTTTTSNSTTSNNSSSPTATPTSVPTNTPTPSTQNYTVAITSPNGGETYSVGNTMHITWSATGTFNTFTLTGIDSLGIAYTIASISNSDTRSYDWTVNIGNSSIDRQLKIQIVANKYPQYVGDQTIQQTDFSDNYFTVNR